MITFLISIAALILGYVFYGRFVERIFVINPNRKTPAYTLQDGVDYVPLPWSKVFLIQFLNIAGLGPIFGAVLGAVYGPVAFLWIVFGNIIGGAMHDFFSGMLSLRSDGKSISEVVGMYLGTGVKQFMRGFTIILMILVGAVFVIGPAKILNGMTVDYLPFWFWLVVIFGYYIIATLLPIDKIIGRIYPIFGFALLFMALGIFVMMVYHWLPVPELTPENFHNMKTDAGEFPVFPLMFVTIACGAISGFHSTQSPLMARCITNEKLGRRVFYGAMITEGIVALIWAAVGMSFFGGVSELNSALAEHQNNAAWVVSEISNSLLGKVGAVLALLGVVAAPISSADTAFRSARLIIADFLKLNQKPIRNRIYIATPLFVIAYLLLQFDFDIIWRYMAWANQTLATIVLWAITVYLAQAKKPYIIALIPATFMTAVISAYILVSPEGFQIDVFTGQITGAIVGCLFMIAFLVTKNKIGKKA